MNAPKKSTSVLIIVLAVVFGLVVIGGGTLAAVGAFGARSYVAAAKAAEARSGVTTIAKSLAHAAGYEQPDGRPFKLTSLPPVPAVVPRGEKYMSNPAEWAAWNSINFSMSTPQRYQYEVRAAADGQSAEVIARGDLNGDGVLAIFSLKVKVSSGVVNVASAIDETNPQE